MKTVLPGIMVVASAAEEGRVRMGRAITIGLAGLLLGGPAVAVVAVAVVLPLGSAYAYVARPAAA